MSSFFEKAKYDALHGNYLVRLLYLNIGMFFLLLVGSSFSALITGNFNSFEGLAQNWLALPSDPFELLYKPWTLLTYMFVHFSFFHLLFNMIILHFSGTLLMQYLGEKRMLALYIYGGLAGGILYMVLYNISPLFATGGHLVGASAGILAILVAGALYMPDMTVRLWGILEIKYWMLAAGLVLLDIINITGPNAGGRIAHLGGAIIAYFFIQSMRKGHEWNVYLFQVIDAVRNLFTGAKGKGANKGFSFGDRPYKAKKTSSNGRSRSAHNITPEDEARVNSILEKIEREGYDKLTKEEKSFLFKFSQK